ncbi:glycosyltransferase [Acidovorax sp. BoFeN1]|uniref:glycosyltransferase n=1 Tax=Acidovorax sp. BoFeN1 TaxID=1231053 RepID=UPI000E093950|nr:glycosyltransferase [Acidovorax sp. BoFeN1]RDD93903.1 glycosyltransferase [Acidovorax sp. BoFeN1]
MLSCPVCGKNAAHFLPLPDQYAQTLRQFNAPFSLSDFETLNIEQYNCPSCQASDRDRLYAHFIRRHLLRPGLPPLRILDIAPAPALSDLLRGIGGRGYRSADLASPLADERVDVTDMRVYADNSFDLVICSHVLEHVDDDAAAIREMHRVLAPGGCAILMVPILTTATETDEDPAETRVEERWRRFGQNDHVRMYAKGDFVARLRSGGFTVEEWSQTEFGEAVFQAHGIRPGSVLYISRKPAAAGEKHPSRLLPQPPLASDDDEAAAPVQVTVAIPAYKATFLDAALQSALTQDFDSFEIVVCDDCPDDSVARAVAPYLQNAARVPVHYYRNPHPLGEESNVGRCIQLARGAYVKFLYDDDLLLPGCLRTLSEVLDQHPHVSIASSRRQVIDETGASQPDIAATLFPFHQDVLIDGADLTSFLADWTLNFIGEPSTVMLRRAQLLPLAGGPFSLDGEPVYWLGDMTMHVQLLRQGHLALLEQPLSCLRISAEQTSHTGRINPGIGKERYAYFQRTIRAFGWQRDQDNHLVRVAALDTSQQFEVVDLGQRLGRMLRGEHPLSEPVPQPPSEPPLRNWLAQRCHSDAQMRMVEARLAQAAPSFGIHVFVHAPQGCLPQLMDTLDSLRAVHGLQGRVRVSVLSPNSDGLAPGTHHVPLERSEDWPAAVNAQAAASTADWLLAVEAGETFTPSGLLMVALELLDAPGCRAVYADELVQTEAGDLGSLFRPDFNLDMLLSCPAGISRHWLFQREVLLQAGGFDPVYWQAPEFELLLRLLETGGLNGLGHVSEPLLIASVPQLASNAHEIAALEKHLHARGYENAAVDSRLPGCYRIHYGHATAPMVSLIIPTKDQFAMVERCVRTVLEKTGYPHYEILLVDNASTAPDACAWLDALEAQQDERIRVLRYPHPFNYSAINNMAARAARGEYLVLLNNDTAALHEDWLDAMLNHALRPEVGIVGAKLFYPNGTIQHAGVVLGLRGPAEHPFIDMDGNASGYMQRLEIDQNYSAVTGACLMVRRALYEQVDGLDEGFQVSYNDVDLCLKVRESGHLIVWTPHAMLLHEGSVSQKQVDTAALAAKAARFQGEQDALYRKWLPTIARDAMYNPNLSLQGAAFELEMDTGLNWNPLPWRPLPVVLAIAADTQARGHARIVDPALSMAAGGLADVRVSVRHYSLAELERLQPDAWVLQHPINDAQAALIRRHAQFTRAFKVAELDTWLPVASRNALGLADRLVVPTDALAEALAGSHPDIRVVPTRLPPAWWTGLPCRRRAGTRARVGWVGDVGNHDGLELLVDMVNELADEVEWVFLGACPAPLRPFVHELHEAVSIDQYPRKLASLNLDLAVAPLEPGLLNECKSNQRLLEYGACGVPVVCSDLTPYRGTLPVTRVHNRFEDWVDAIRSHTSDLDASARMGDRLRDAVLSGWMLEGMHLEEWANAWVSH